MHNALARRELKGSLDGIEFLDLHASKRYFQDEILEDGQARRGLDRLRRLDISQAPQALLTSLAPPGCTTESCA